MEISALAATLKAAELIARSEAMEMVEQEVSRRTTTERENLARAMHAAYRAGMTATEIRNHTGFTGNRYGLFKAVWEAVPGAPEIIRGRAATKPPVRYVGLHDFGAAGQCGEELVAEGYTGTTWPAYRRDNGEMLMILFDAGEYPNRGTWDVYAVGPMSDRMPEVPWPTREERDEVRANIRAWKVEEDWKAVFHR